MRKHNQIQTIFFGFAVLLILVGITFIWLGGQISYLSCIRLETSRIDCQLDRRFLDLFLIDRELLPRVTASEVKEDCFDGCRYWIELLTGRGAVRLTAFSSYNRPDVLADQKRLEAFLSNPDLKSFEYVGSPSWTMLLSSLPLLTVGCFLAVSYGRRLFEG